MKKTSVILIIIFIAGIFLNPVNYESIQAHTENLSVENMSTNNILNINFKHSIDAYNNDIISMLQQVDTLMVLQYIEDLVAYGPRVTGTSACIDAGNYIYNEFKSMGLNVRYQNWSDDSFSGTNIEASLPGTDDSSDEMYIICAHYDTYPNSPGADDNAAGTAAVLTAAKILSQYTFDHTIRFVTFSGEMVGDGRGSTYYVNEVHENGDNIVAVLDPDGIGYAKSENAKGKVYALDNKASEWITDFTDDVAQQYFEYIGLEVERHSQTGVSAHTNFYKVGYDAICYFEYEYNPDIYKPGDIIENMNPSYASNVSKLCVATLAELSHPYNENAPDKPSTPTGPATGKPGVESNYSSIASDPQGDQIYYLFSWDDGTDSGWLGPYNSGEQCTASHSWSKRGNYEIKVKAKDSNGAESDWSDPLPVTMPYSYNKPILQFLELLFQRFPNAFSILRHLLEL